MSDNKETLGKLFEYAIELEKAAETLYNQMAKMFAHHPDVAKFWSHYANEEKGHASFLERIKSGVSAERLSSPADGNMVEDVKKCLILSSQNSLSGIQNLDDAYQLATELENSETNSIFEFIVVNFSTDELARSHKFLKTQISTHIEELERGFPSGYKSRASRQNTTILIADN